MDIPDAHVKLREDWLSAEPASSDTPASPSVDGNRRNPIRDNRAAYTMHSENCMSAIRTVAIYLVAPACGGAVKWVFDAYSSPRLVGELLVLFRLCG